MHRHRVVDNQRPVPKGTKFFPSYLQTSGYDTAFVGKWHMGHESDAARPGFNHWASFAGQGKYFDPIINVNGNRKQFEGYNADILTSLALDWLKQERDQPFFLYLSFKAVHYPFQPPKRFNKRYEDESIDYPETMANSEENYRSQSRWIRERRYSIHGIDHMETGAYDKDPVPSFDDFYKNYCEAVHGLDENIGRLLTYLDEAGLSKNTTVIYMGDNGFALGEHGFYDKRDAFEESIRVPLLVYAPDYVKSGTKINQMVQNIDIAPTVLSMCGVDAPKTASMSGESFLPLLQGKNIPWRDHILYEYHWEWNFPATPTLFAIRNERFKYIYYHGVWDDNGFYDLKTDPHERFNLIHVPAFQQQIASMRNQLFTELESLDALNIPVRRPKGDRLDDRKLRR